MKTIELSTATQPLSNYVDELGDEPIVLTLNNTPVAALVSLRDLDTESLMLSTNPEFLSIIEQARAEFRAGEKLSLEEMRRAVAE